MRRRIVVATALLAAATGCEQALPDPSIVTRLRILAVRAEPPEVTPGTKVHFDALYADPDGKGRALKKAWAICDPGTAGVGSCGDPTHVSVLGSNETADFSVPATALDGLDATRSAIGRDLYVVFGVEAVDPVAGDNPDHDIAFKRLRVSTNTSPNTNPRISKVLVNDLRNPSGPIDIVKNAFVPLHAEETLQSQQKWQSPDGASGVENGRFDWLITGGSVVEGVSYADANAGTSVDNHWRLPNDESATLWVVLRDGRGGIDWATQAVTLH